MGNSASIETLKEPDGKSSSIPEPDRAPSDGTTEAPPHARPQPVTHEPDMESLTTLLTDPRTLRCTHSFCLTCLESAVEETPQENENIKCPTCQELTPRPASNALSDLPVSKELVYLQKTFEQLAHMSSGGRTLVICDACTSSRRPASIYCHECGDMLCADCYKEHQHIPRRRDHMAEDISDMLLCRHDQERSEIVAFYCHTCEETFCKKCARGTKHREHEAGKILEESSKLRQKLHDLVESNIANTDENALLEYEADLKQHVSKAKHEKDRIAKIMNETLKLMTRLQEKINKEQKLQEGETSIASMETYIDEFQQKKASRMEVLNRAGVLVENAKPVELLNHIGEVKPELSSRPPHSTMSPPPTLNIPLADLHENVRDTIKSLIGGYKPQSKNISVNQYAAATQTDSPPTEQTPDSDLLKYITPRS